MAVLIPTKVPQWAAGTTGDDAGLCASINQSIINQSTTYPWRKSRDATLSISDQSFVSTPLGGRGDLGSPELSSLSRQLASGTPARRPLPCLPSSMPSNARESSLGPGGEQTWGRGPARLLLPRRLTRTSVAVAKMMGKNCYYYHHY